VQSSTAALNMGGLNVHYSQSGGTFQGGSGAIQATSLGISGGTFNSTPGTLAVGGVGLSGGVFNPNGGTVSVTGSFGIQTGATPTFYNLTLANTVTMVFYAGPSVNVYGTLNLGNYICGDNFIAYGNVINSNTSYGSAGTYCAQNSLSFNGTSTQTYTGSATPGIGALGNVFVNNPGQVVVQQGITISGTLTVNSGTVNFGTSMVTLFPYTGEPYSLPASIAIQNLAFGSDHSGSISIATGTVINVGNSFSYVGTTWAVLTGGGQINVAGNFYDANTSMSHNDFHAPLVNLVMNGTGTQYVYATSTGVDSGVLPVNLVINNTGGKVYIVGTLNLPITGGGGWSDLSGNVNAGTSTVVFDVGNSACNEFGYQATANLSGNTQFNNLEIFGDVCGVPGWAYPEILTVSTGLTPSVNGTFIVSGNSSASAVYIPLINGGTLQVNGNIQALAPSGTIGAGGGGTATIAVVGTSTQTFTDTLGTHWQMPQLLINTPNRTALLGFGSILLGSTTIQQGEFWIPASSTNPTPAIDLGGNLTISSLGALRIFQPSSTLANAATSNVTITNNGLVEIDAPNSGCNQSPSVYLTGGASNKVVWAGSGKNIIRYVYVSYQSSASMITTINSLDGSPGGTNTNWAFPVLQPPAMLVQSTTAYVGGNSDVPFNITMPWGVRPGDTMVVPISFVTVGNFAQGPSFPPTDNAGNKYQLLATSTQIYGSWTEYLYLFYAKNVSGTAPFTITFNVNDAMATVGAFDYTGVTPSSTVETFNTNSYAVPVGTSTAGIATSNYVNTASPDDLYVGAMYGSNSFCNGMSSSTTTPWTSEASAGGYSEPCLNVEDYVASTTQYLAATWNTAGVSSYSAIIAAFRSAIIQSYPPMGVLDSATYDLRSPAALNSFTWRGTTPSGSSVNFQFAVSNSPSGPWNYVGPDGTSNTVYSGLSGTSIPLQSCSLYSSCYSLFSNYQYFRYRVTLLSNGMVTPTVTGVVVNWSL